MGKITLTFIGKLELDRELDTEHALIINDNIKVGEYGPPTKHCPYMVTEDNKGLEFNVVTIMGMKMNPNLKCYDDWLKKLIDRFLQPWGYIVNGTIKLVNYDFLAAEIKVTNNVVSVWEGMMIYNREKVKYMRDLEINNQRLTEENGELKKQIKLLKSELKYQPGGTGALKAEIHFQELTNGILSD